MVAEHDEGRPGRFVFQPVQPECVFGRGRLVPYQAKVAQDDEIVIARQTFAVKAPGGEFVNIHGAVDVAGE